MEQKVKALFEKNWIWSALAFGIPFVWSTSTSGLVPVFVMFISAGAMCVCGILINKLKWKWVNDYALPICMVLGMALAIPLTAWLG